MLERIAKLLAKAENASTQEEAESYFAKAQELATLHQISLAEAAAHHPDQKAKSVLTHRTITIGERGKQVNSHLVYLFSVIALQNDVTINIAHNSTYVIAFGHSDDIDAVELMWSRIAPIMVRMGEQYLKTDEWRGETEYRSKRVKVEGWYRDYYEEIWDHYPVTKQSARASYYQGFRQALGERLRKQRKETIAQAQQAHDEAGDGVSTDLVLVNKAALVKDYYKQHSTARGSYRGGRSGGSGRAANAGHRDGSRVSLSGASIGGSRKGLSA